MRMGAALAGLSLLSMVLPTVAHADEGDAPSGPEACVVEVLEQRRSEAGVAWSGSIQDELREHASAMADSRRLSHVSLDERVAGLPDGWSGYGEASYTGPLVRTDEEAVEAWCRDAVASFWDSPTHREVLEQDAHHFVAVGTHWDGEQMWMVTGVYSHPDFEPAPVDWPTSYTRGLMGGWQGSFYDDDGSMFEQDIEDLAGAGLTRGCNPPTGTRFCPDATVTRGEMAAFLTRAFGWEGGASTDRFSDDDGSVFEGDIEALTDRGVARGCNPPLDDRFCPDRPVTRGEMATFLARSLRLAPASGGRFRDTGESVHRTHIDAVAEAGITVGCDPDGIRYCPDGLLSRGQMAAFLARAGLSG